MLLSLKLVKTMSRKELTSKLSGLVEKHINPNNDTRIYLSKEVTFEYQSSHPIRVDYVRFKPINNSVSGIEKGDFYCYEIKSCLDDFNSKNGHNFIGDYNYYVMSKELYEIVKEKIPYDIGVYTLAGKQECLECAKKAKRHDRKYPALQMLLMMFRSANRENIKNRNHS